MTERPAIGEGVRFVLAGGLNTVLTYALYYGLLALVDYRLAYALAYVAGIGIAYVLNARFVFRRALGWRSALRYPLIYVAQFLFGVALLHSLVDWLGIDRRWAMVIVIALSVPLSYVLNRLVLVRSPQ
ncbi:GtrA family protein [Tahibacter amnicola]|uniref:GtrA family protein n=1 Tax=Tahibacter amnicola TaxID=2976241 RepID=A0ABY6BFX7_9GAMM|nr:GtrA family protein [Tahibacter amnicola]UXI67511.1 GtrA family protein [Tahibacter amnicola]